MRQRSRPARTIEPDAAASIASRAQRVVTIAIRPSVGHETAGVLKLICPTAKAENFCEEGWTLLEVRQSAEVICPSGKDYLSIEWRCPASFLTRDDLWYRELPPFILVFLISVHQSYGLRIDAKAPFRNCGEERPSNIPWPYSSLTHFPFPPSIDPAT